MKKLLLATSMLAAAVTGAQAADFVNGGFETGDFTGWQQGGGTWSGSPALPLNPSSYNGGSPTNTIVGNGTDANTGGALSTVFNGNYSARANDANNNRSVSTIYQSVTNYSSDKIYFAWAAVLQASHTFSDSDNFGIKLVDDTTHTTLVDIQYNSANAPVGLFNIYQAPDVDLGGGNFFTPAKIYYTNWQPSVIDVAAGHDYTLSLLASDCPYGGHWGYAYLDSFGSTEIPGATPLPNPTVNAPEPATMAMLGLGLAGLAAARRRRNKA